MEQEKNQVWENETGKYAEAALSFVKIIYPSEAGRIESSAFDKYGAEIDMENPLTIQKGIQDKALVVDSVRIFYENNQPTQASIDFRGSEHSARLNLAGKAFADFSTF